MQGAREIPTKMLLEKVEYSLGMFGHNGHTIAGAEFVLQMQRSTNAFDPALLHDGCVRAVSTDLSTSKPGTHTLFSVHLTNLVTENISFLLEKIDE